MRIGLDTRLTYYTQGGIARYIRALATYLPALASPHNHVHLYRRGHAENFSRQARRVDCWTPAHHILEGWALAVEIAGLGLDLLHSPDFIPPRWGYGRSVITVHDLAFWRYPEFLTAESRRYYNGQIEWAVRRAAAISADSQATQDDLVNLLNVPSEKVKVIHLGHDPRFSILPNESVRPVLARLGLESGYVLCVGTFEPRKNVPGLVRAYAQLRDAPPLVLVGNRGWLFTDTLKLIQDLKLETRVHFFENLPAGDLPAVYNGAGVFALPSFYEGFGFPVLEAMGCGVPCVIANRASLPEIAGEAALAVDPDQTDALAAALERVLSESDLRHSLRQKGLERVGHFTWEKTARETLALYNRVLDLGDNG
jgi:glycosyltransferase involved in cell wall biosynthesis